METEQDDKVMGARMLAVAEAREGGAMDVTGPDGQIVAAIGSGDLREAIALSARLHGPAIGRLCMAMVGSQAEASELAQETLMTAFEAFRSYRGEGTVRAFLFGVARRVCSRHLELRVRRDARLRLVHAAGHDGGDTAELAARKQAGERARQALELLRPTERDAVVLRFAAELSFKEVADACGIDEPTARKRVSRALARLRETVGVG